MYGSGTTVSAVRIAGTGTILDSTPLSVASVSSSTQPACAGTTGGFLVAWSDDAHGVTSVFVNDNGVLSCPIQLSARSDGDPKLTGSDDGSFLLAHARTDTNAGVARTLIFERTVALDSSAMAACATGGGGSGGAGGGTAGTAGTTSGTGGDTTTGAGASAGDSGVAGAAESGAGGDASSAGTSSTSPGGVGSGGTGAVGHAGSDAAGGLSAAGAVGSAAGHAGTPASNGSGDGGGCAVTPKQTTGRGLAWLGAAMMLGLARARRRRSRD
jgi:MYXO-CTERM domain-containing protein